MQQDARRRSTPISVCAPSDAARRIYEEQRQIFVEERRASACSLQRLFRQRRVARRLQAAIVLQSAWRRYDAGKKVRSRREINTVMVGIYRQSCGSVAEKDWLHQRNIRSAVKVQSLCRRHSAVKGAQSKARAIVRIQRCWRRYSRACAAVLIQSFCLRYCAVKEVCRQREVRRVQDMRTAAERMRKMRSQATRDRLKQRQTNAAVKIQAAIRGFLTRQDIEEEHRLLVRLGFLGRAATTIQRIYRGHVVRVRSPHVARCGYRRKARRNVHFAEVRDTVDFFPVGDVVEDAAASPRTREFSVFGEHY
jgi:hypothetical protein